ncbi:universal stress protein [Prosthecobacter sp.]|uniref:universal stress protein n=1 Tax=Prosthecobacter sp. TaxID=1965333 RepID=UPI00378393E0
MKTIVALVDLSDLSFKVLKQAHALATAFKSEVVILHVVPKEPVVVDVGLVSPTVMRAPSPGSVQVQYEQLEEMRESLMKFGVKARVEQFPGAEVDTVLEEISRLGAELVIVGSHHHSRIYNLLIGSVSNDVLMRAKCPVLVVPGGEG